MKRSLKLFAVSLVVGSVLSSVGVVMIRRANVNISSVYDIIEENLQSGDSQIRYQKAEPFDISDIKGGTLSDEARYQLNEFNTIEVYAENCTVEFKPTDDDFMRISIAHPDKFNNKVFLRTAVENGTLYVQDNLTGVTNGVKDIVINVSVPDNYKGGYSLNGSNAEVKLCDLESAMDMSFNLYNSAVSAQTLSAGEVVFEMSGTTVSAGEIHSRGEFSLSGISSVMKTDMLEAVSSRINVNNSTLNIGNIVGGVSADMKMSAANLDFLSVTGNISAVASESRLNIKIPNDSPVSLRHEESYSSFSDKVKWTDEGQKNENSRYFIETTVKFSIVTLEEKE